MKKTVRWIVIGLLIIAAVPLLSWASSYTPRTPNASENWSRGHILGHTLVKQPVALKPGPEGGVFVVWPNLDGRLELAHVSEDGELLVNQVLVVGTDTARNPDMEIGQDGRLHLLWQDRGSIHFAHLAADGTPLGQSITLAERSDRATGSSLAYFAGTLYAFWSDDTGVRWATLSEEGEILKDPATLIPEAHSSLVEIDNQGQAHMIWHEGIGNGPRSIFYATLDLESGELGTAHLITEILLSGRLRLEAVAMGLSQDTGTVLWSEYDRGFDRYSFRSATIPLGAPEQLEAREWRLKMGDGPMEIAVTPGQQPSILIALSERIMSESENIELQISLLKMEDDYEVEEFVTASSQASMAPSVAVDDRENLHLAWLDTGGFGEFKVVYASTAPAVIGNYNTTTLWDIVDTVFSGFFSLSMLVVGGVAGMVMWAVIPMIGLLVYHRASGHETLETLGAWVALGIAAAVQIALMFALPIRFGLEASSPALRWIAPLVSVTLATGATAFIVNRRKERSLFLVFFLFTALNTALQIAIYLLF
jgi:hypothetical protein